MDADAEAISFGTDGWRAHLDEFTVPRLRMVGQAVLDHLDAQNVEGGLAVGYDARPTSREFAEELARVLAAGGRDVELSERDCPTPLVAFAVVDRDLAGGMMVTASHNPPEYNGVKFIPADGAPALPAVTESVERRLASPDPRPEAEWGAVRERDFVAPHAEHVLGLVDADLSGLRVVYDAMHGSGRGVTDRLLERAGATVIGRRCERDPEFGGTPPEPAEERLQGLHDAVREEDADIGIANDGDADRIGIVTPGGFLDENLFFGALYDYLLEDGAGPAVRSVSTTFLVDRIAQRHGEETIEVPVGFKWVAEAMAEHDALIGGEESGGFSVRGHVREKDGVLAAAYAAAAAADRPLEQRVDDLLAEYGEIHQGKVSVDCPDDRKAGTIDALGADIPEAVDGTPVDSVNDVDGFKLLLADGAWLLVRPSGTEPKLRVYAEAETERRVEDLLDAGRELVEGVL